MGDALAAAIFKVLYSRIGEEPMDHSLPVEDDHIKSLIQIDADVRSCAWTEPEVLEQKLSFA